MSSSTVTVQITGGPTITVPWTSGMNAQQALEGAWNAQVQGTQFTYGLQYYGSTFGYLVMMINETYDSFASTSAPYFYWLFSVNGQSANQGIDSTVLNAGDTVGFALTQYVPSTQHNAKDKEPHAQLTAKFRAQQAVLGGGSANS
jgi:hypothetical protein